MANPNVTLNFFCVSLTVTTTRQNLWTMIQNYFNANRATDLLNWLLSNRCSTFSVFAAKPNTNRIYFGDSTLVASTTVPVGVMSEMDAGDQFFIPLQGGGPITNDLADYFVQTTTGTAILHVGVRRV